MTGTPGSQSSHLLVALQEVTVNTRTIAIVALVIAALLLLFLVILPRA